MAYDLPEPVSWRAPQNVSWCPHFVWEMSPTGRCVWTLVLQLVAHCLDCGTFRRGSLAGGVCHGVGVESSLLHLLPVLSLSCIFVFGSVIFPPPLAVSCHTFLTIIDSLSETKGQITFPSKVVFYLSSRKALRHVLGLLMSDFAWYFFKAQCKFLALRSPHPPTAHSLCTAKQDVCVRNVSKIHFQDCSLGKFKWKFKILARMPTIKLPWLALGIFTLGWLRKGCDN